MINILKQIGIINFIDVGCSGSLDKKWSRLFTKLRYVGFNPNQEECRRLEIQNYPYHSARFLPYAIAGENGIKTIHMTESISCYSFTEPNSNLVKSFLILEYIHEVSQILVNLRL